MVLTLRFFHFVEQLSGLCHHYLVKTLINIWTNPETGTKFRFEYNHTDSFEGLDVNKVRQVYGVCFYKNQIVIVKIKSMWILPGGRREEGESIEEVLKREIMEETNMEVLEWKPIGVQTVFEFGNEEEPYYQLRVMCRVRPFGPFVSDPDGGVIANKLIDPKDYKQYFDWGEIGEEIIKKAILLSSS